MSGFRSMAVVVVVMVAVTVPAAVGVRLLKLSAALFGLSAVLAMAPDGPLQVVFGLAYALFTFIITVAGLRRQNAADQGSSQHGRNQASAKHKHPSKFRYLASD